VNTKLKAFIIWLMLLAMPLQGFASATMLLCAPTPANAAHEHARVAVQPAHHHPVLETQGTAGHMHPDVASTHHAHDCADGAQHHADSKCGSCATCCYGAGMVPTFASALPVQAPRFEVIPFDSGYVPTVDLALPERPPRV
jgi:hypothetical protein